MSPVKAYFLEIDFLITCNLSTYYGDNPRRDMVNLSTYNVLIAVNGLLSMVITLGLERLILLIFLLQNNFSTNEGDNPLISLLNLV